MDKKYIVNLQGRDFTTYEGLLDDAHAKGLKSIRTVLIQVPTEANGNIAICQAEVELANPDGEVKTFTGIGDANPRNVNRNIANHLIRMAETRAKARALRDATNNGMTAYEETEQADLPKEDGAQPQPGRSQVASMPAQEAAQAGAAKLATRATIDAITKEMKRTGFSQEQGRSYLQRNFNGKSSRLELAEEEAQQFLDHLKTLPAAEAAQA